MKFQEIIKFERQKQGLTQKQMAEKLNIALKTYKIYEEKGIGGRRPSVRILLKISGVLNVSTDYLLGINKA